MRWNVPTGVIFGFIISAHPLSEKGNLVHLIVKVQGRIIVVRPCRTVVQCEHLIRLFAHFGLLFRSRKTGP